MLLQISTESLYCHNLSIYFFDRFDLLNYNLSSRHGFNPIIRAA
jgi:hypothetical protein